MTALDATMAIEFAASAREQFIRQAQAMISDALDMAERLLPFVRNDGDDLYIIVLDECNQRVEFLCDGPFSDWRMARTALERVNELLNQQDAHLIAGLLEHADLHALKI